MTGHSEVLPRPSSVQHADSRVKKSSFSTKVLGFWRNRTRVRWQNDAISGAPPGAGESHPGFPVVTDDRRVDIGAAVDLRRPEEAAS